MRRLLLLLLFFLAACGSTDTAQTPSALAELTAAPAVDAAITATRVPETPARQPATLPPTRTPFPTAISSTPTSQAAQGFSVRLHPDGSLYVGDRISFEVIAPAGVEAENRPVRVEFPTAGGSQTAEGRFGRHGIGGRMQASLLWAWDTSGLAPGIHTLRFIIGDNGPVWVEKVNLLPEDMLPKREVRAGWQVVDTECCQVSYITGTLADRNLEDVLDMIDAQAQRAAERLDVRLTEPVRIVLLPRVLGHGGFASSALSVSYLDRDYLGGDKASILHHEIVHILDSRLGGEMRPTMLVEGFAVYVTGGHFKPEALLPRAAALLPPEPGCADWSAAGSHAGSAEACGLDRFISLKTLADDFYNQQHEIGYLEAGALIEYMVNTWGWPAYSEFYRNIQPQKANGSNRGSHSAAIDAALQEHFGLGLVELEQRFRAGLAGEFVTSETAADLDLTLQLYDTVRRYQQELDPSAHFLTAWLLDAEEMRRRGIVADYLRSPSAPENLALETMLAEAAAELEEADFVGAGVLLAASNLTLDRHPEDGLQAFSAHPVAADYLALVGLALEAGYEPLRIAYENDTARMLVQTSEPGVTTLAFARQPQGWTIQTASGQNLGPLVFSLRAAP